MRISNKGKELIKEVEGFRSNAYKCSAGKLTVGYGHVIQAEEKILKEREINKEIAETLLEKDIRFFEKYINEVLKKYKVTLNQNQFDALISFCYNTGYLRNSMLERLKEGKLEELGEALSLYNKANGKEIEGLTKRRQKEKELFFSQV